MNEGKKKLYFAFILMCLGGCGLPFSQLLPPSDEEVRQETSTALYTFIDLLNQGWELYVNEDGRLVLTKYVNKQLLVKDIFGELKK